MKARSRGESGSDSRRARRGAFAAGAALVLAFGCASPQPAPPAPVGEVGVYRVAPPDDLHVSVLPDPAIDRDVTVRPDGKISIDLVGDVQASGRTPEEIAREIQERIGKYKRDPVVTVSVKNAASNAITVLGEVNNPTHFALDKDLRVVEAIGRVGGPTLYAADQRIRVIRGSEGGQPVVMLVDLDDIEDGDLSTNIQLRGGDLIYVPPTYMAQIGYALAGLFFPFQQIFSFGAQGAVKVFTGGML